MNSVSPWPHALLGEVVEFERATIDPRDAGDRRYVGLEHVASDGTILGGAPEAGSLASSKFKFGPRHILYGKLRPYLRKVARPDFEGICSTDILPLLPSEGVDRDYLFHALRDDAFVSRATARSAGVNLPRISPRLLADFSIPLPPRSEQERIAAILDKTDAIRAKRRSMLADADALLRAAFLSQFGDPVTNPRGWETRPLGELLTAIDSGWSPICEDEPAPPGNWGVLKLSAVTRGLFAPGENKRLPAGVAPRPQLEVKSHDLLFTRKNTRELVAATVYAIDPPEKLMISDLIFRLRVDPALAVPAFIWRQLADPAKRREAQALAGGSAGSMPNISKERLRTLTMIVPPVELQRRFSRFALAQLSLRGGFEAALTEADALYGSIAQRAFRGEL